MSPRMSTHLSPMLPLAALAALPAGMLSRQRAPLTEHGATVHSRRARAVSALASTSARCGSRAARKETSQRTAPRAPRAPLLLLLPRQRARYKRRADFIRVGVAAAAAAAAVCAV